MKTCPFCAELIQDKAIKCRYCHEWLEEPPADRVVEESKVVSSTELSQEQLRICDRLKCLPEKEIEFLYRAIHKYFPETVASDPISRDELNQISLKLLGEHPKALEALLSIYQI